MLAYRIWWALACVPLILLLFWYLLLFRESNLLLYFVAFELYWFFTLLAYHWGVLVIIVKLWWCERFWRSFGRLIDRTPSVDLDAITFTILLLCLHWIHLLRHRSCFCDVSIFLLMFLENVRCRSLLLTIFATLLVFRPHGFVARDRNIMVFLTPHILLISQQDFAWICWMAPIINHIR